jgi:hypothetical protein
VDLYRVFWWDGRSVGDGHGGPLYVPKRLQRSGRRGSRHNGFIWPSVLNPEWRNVTLFGSRVPGRMSVEGTIAPLALDYPAVQEACRYLGIAANRPG